MDARKLGIALIALLPLAAGAQNAEEDAVAEYETLLREIRGLEQYNALLERQIAQQQENIVSRREDIDKIPDLERQIPPLLITIVDGLEAFVERDLPFLIEERQKRINDLYGLIEDPQASTALQLRRVLEAWSIEVEYGNAFQFESGQVTIDGNERSVDFLVLGRAGLLFQSNDEELLTGVWDHANREWIILGSDYRNPVRQALRMARNQVAPDLVLLPVLAPGP